MSSINSPPLGRFIVLDGCEGTGKTSILQSLGESLPKESTVFTREPGGTRIAEEVRRLLLDPIMQMEPLTEFLLFWSARAEHLQKIIRPALLAGKNVVCDRFDSSTFAYQIWGRENHSLIPAFDVMREITCRDVKPDLYVYLDVDPEIGLKRISGRGEADRIEAEGYAFHVRVRAGYLDFFRKHPHKLVDARKPLEEVVTEAVDIVCAALSSRDV